MQAVVKGDLSLIRQLLDRWPLLHERLLPVEYGITPLCMAVRKSQVAIVRELLARGAAVDAVAENGSTPLMFAAQAGHLELVDLLLGMGGDPNWINEKMFSMSVLEFAIRGKRLEVCKRLVEKGARLDVVNSSPHPKRGAPDIWGPRRTPLEHIVFTGFTEFIKWLLETKKCMPDQRTSAYDAPLIYIAAARGNLPIANLLIDHGACLNPTFSINGETYRNILSVAEAFKQFGVIESLITRFWKKDQDLENATTFRFSAIKTNMAFDLLTHQSLVSGDSNAAANGLQQAFFAEQVHKLFEEAGELACFSDRQKLSNFAIDSAKQGWSTTFLSGVGHPDFAAVARLLGKNPFKSDRNAPHATPGAAQRLEMVVHAVASRIPRAKSMFKNLGLTVKCEAAMTQMVMLQSEIMSTAITQVRTRFALHVATLPDIAMNRFISLSHQVNERDLYRVLTKEWGLYDPLARAAIRMVKVSYEKLRHIPESGLPESFKAMPPAARLKAVMTQVLDEWDKIEEMVAVFHQSKSLGQLDLLSDLLFTQWRHVCAAFGVQKPVWVPPEQRAPAEATSTSSASSSAASSDSASSKTT